MMFCPKCGSLMKPGKDGKLTCSRCGFLSGLQAQKLTEKSSHTKVAVVEEEKEIHPKTEAICPKCGNKEAYFWTTQTRAADEPETRFYRCTKCKRTWREYK